MSTIYELLNEASAVARREGNEKGKPVRNRIELFETERKHKE